MSMRKRPSTLSRELEFLQIPIPNIGHPSRVGWKNEANQAYEDIYGKPISQAPKDLPIPFPKDTFQERFKQDLKTGLLKSMFALLSYFKKERGTHHFGGVGAKGTIRYLQNDATKKLPFCDYDQSLPFVLRHSNASFEDDGCSQLRAMAFRVSLPDGQVHDFLLSTGGILPFWSVSSLMNFAGYRNKVKNDDWSPQKIWLEESPTAFVTAIEATRYAPESYAKMSYYSAIPYGIIGTSDFVKFRVMPKDMDKESGLLISELQRRVWIQGRLVEHDKPIRYLADEYKKRLSEQKTIEYHLEAQFRTLKEEDTDEFFNSARYWDEEIHPWKAIATLTADLPLDETATEDLAYWLGNVPNGLDFMESISADDYNSVASSRIRIYPRAQRLRKKKRN